MTNLFGDPDSPAKKPTKEKPQPIDLDARLAEIKSQPKKTYLAPVYRDAVPWYGLFYSQIAEKGLLQAVKDHIHFELAPEQALDYRKYLVFTLNFPKNWLLTPEDA